MKRKAKASRLRRRPWSSQESCRIFRHPCRSNGGYGKEVIFYLKKAAVKAKVAELERYRKEEELELTIMGLLPVSSSLSFFRRSASSFMLLFQNFDLLLLSISFRRLISYGARYLGCRQGHVKYAVKRKVEFIILTHGLFDWCQSMCRRMGIWRNASLKWREENVGSIPKMAARE